MINQHVLVCIVNNSEDMGWNFSLSLSSEVSNHFICINWQSSVRVDGDAKETRVCLKGEGSGYANIARMNTAT